MHAIPTYPETSVGLLVHRDPASQSRTAERLHIWSNAGPYYLFAVRYSWSKRSSTLTTLRAKQPSHKSLPVGSIPTLLFRSLLCSFSSIRCHRRHPSHPHCPLYHAKPLGVFGRRHNPKGGYPHHDIVLGVQPHMQPSSEPSKCQPWRLNEARTKCR